jgi:hypothetical protein
LGAFFWARGKRAQKNRAFRSKSSDLQMQILRAFRCNPIARAQRLSYTVNPENQNFYRKTAELK